MLRQYRVVISLIVLIAVLLSIYQLFWVPYRQSRVVIPINPLVPDLPSVVPSPTDQIPAATPGLPPEMPVPDGRFAYYLGISNKGLVTIYRWVEGSLVVVQELNQLHVERLRSEDKDELRAFIGANTEEEIWQKVEGLAH